MQQDGNLRYAARLGAANTALDDVLSGATIADLVEESVRLSDSRVISFEI